MHQKSFFTAEPEADEEYGEPHETMAYMLRVTRGIMDPDYTDEEAFINEAAADFLRALEKDPYKPRVSWMAGVNFYNRIVQHAKIPSVRILSEWPIPYRDDNRFFWEFSENMFETQGIEYMPSSQETVRKYVSVMEMVNEINSELDLDNHQEIWVLATELFPHEDDCETTKSYNEMEGVEPVSDPYHYNEWDYHVQLARPDWATVIERKQGVGDPETMDEILHKHKPIASRIRHLIDAMQPQGIVRRRGYEEGEELDLNAAVRAMIDIRRGVMPDPRINIRIDRHIRDLSIVVLMDLSESTNEKVGVSEGEPGCDEAPSILDLTRESTGLLAWAIDSIGDNFAFHGFASDGRHDVQYYRFKDFDQPYDDAAKARMAGMKGGLSTRMGAALRHAGWHLTQQPAQKRLVLLITDGEPADLAAVMHAREHPSAAAAPRPGPPAGLAPVTFGCQAGTGCRCPLPSSLVPGWAASRRMESSERLCMMRPSCSVMEQKVHPPKQPRMMLTESRIISQVSRSISSPDMASSGAVPSLWAQCFG